MSRILTLALNGVYFDQVKRGEKLEEFRLHNAYWQRRLVGRDYDYVVLTKGYPARDDQERRLTVPWRGFSERVITHPHFGAEPVRVFAIRLTECEPGLSPKPSV